MADISKLKEIIGDAISDYASNSEGKTPVEWLQGYLGENLSEKSVDRIHSIASGIISTLDLVEEKKAALNNAIETGESAESWFADEAMEKTGKNGEKARIAAEFLNGITAAENSYNNENCEIIDVDDETWEDDDWNSYRLKDSLKGVAVEAGKAGLREIASEAFIKASEEGIGAVFTDSEFVLHSLTSGVTAGLKIAVSAGLAIAEDKGIISSATSEILAATAHKTIENLAAFTDVIKGNKTFTEAVVEIKNTAVSTFSAMWERCGSQAICDIQSAVSSVFGLEGAVVSGAVTGLLTPAKESSKLVHVIKETGKAVWVFLTKERHIPCLNKLKTKLLNKKEL